MQNEFSNALTSSKNLHKGHDIVIYKCFTESGWGKTRGPYLLTNKREGKSSNRNKLLLLYNTYIIKHLFQRGNQQAYIQIQIV